MAELSKFKHSEVINILKHNLRLTKINSNPDVDPDKTYLNYEIPIQQDSLTAYERYKKRKEEVYCYNRKDVNTLCSRIISAPKELEEEKDIKVFFENCVDFLKNRYGKENLILAVVHRDEGVKIDKVDRWGNKIKDKDGNTISEVVGRPHLHFNFIPITTKDKKHPGGKICFNDVIPREEYRKFHPDLMNFLKSRNDKGADYIVNGVTRRNGKNYSIKELKDKTKNQNAFTFENTKEVSKWER